MLKISGTKLSLTRGDSAYITIKINQENGQPYVLNTGDVISCQVRHEPNGGELLFTGTIEEVRTSEFVWHILPEDTADAEVKTYYWDAQIKMSNGDVFTFIPKSDFKLTDEVTED